MARFIQCLFVLILAISGVLAASAASPSVSAGDGIYQTHVTSVTLDPQVFFPYETGTINVQLTNSGNQTVTLSGPDILDTHLAVLNKGSYSTNVRLGPGSTMTYSFFVKASGDEGTYFPLFTVSTVEAGSISYPFQFEIDATDLDAKIVDKPDNFAINKKDTVNLSLINPRNGDLTDIIITPSGDGVTISPATKFVSVLPEGSSQVASFKVTPNKATDLTFDITYHNGNNNHNTSLVLPINIGEDKTAAVPVINNLALSATGAAHQLTGDVTDAGISDAKSMILTVLPPAKPVEPYGQYAIGSLASDDFSSFTLTFTGDDLADVPVLITWKDADGNTFSNIQHLDLRFVSGSTGSRTGSSGSLSSTSGSRTTSSVNAGGPPGGGSIFGFGGSRSSGISAFYPVIALAIIVVVGAVLYRKRKWLAAKLKRK